jgi:hypothetical protein
MSADFDDRAKLTLDSQAAFGGAQRLSNSMGHLGQQLQGAQGLAGGLLGRVVGLGAAYFGLNAGINVFKGLTTSAMSYTSELEATKIGLQSVLSAVTGASWEEAGKQGEQAFLQIQEAAIKSPASAREMFDIFNGIVGPVLNTGAAMDDVISLTNDATMAAAGLHVDFAQASRDMSMMIRGAAGVDVKLFSLLRASNAIKETTEEWNKNLTAAQRVEKLGEALAKFKQAGDAYGKSWKGVTSTFGDLQDRFKSAFMSPIMSMGARKLGEANDYMAANQAKAAYYFALYGNKVAVWIEHAWDRGVSGAKWVATHWGQITHNIDAAMVKIHTVAPMLLKAAEIYAGVSVASGVAGKGLEFGAKGVALAGVGSAGAAKAAGAFGWIGKTAGLTGAAGAAAGVAGGEAAGAAGSAAAVTSAAAALPVIAVALVAAAGVAPIVEDNWGKMADSMVSVTGNLWGEIVAAGHNVWTAIKPVALVLGNLFTTLAWVLANGVVFAVRAVTAGVSWFAKSLHPVADFLTNEIVPTIRDWWVELDRTSQSLGRFLDMIGLIDLKAKTLTHLPGMAGQADLAVTLSTSLDWAKKKDVTKNLAKQTTKVTNDFRGSHIKIDQKFEGDQDPDRIVVGMMSDLTRQAELRLSSGYAGAFTR